MFGIKEVEIGILHNIQNLQRTMKAIQPEIFKERLIHSYELALLAKLEKACQADNPIETLTSVLAENEKQVKNNCLSYTALPEKELTLLLCDIAEYLGGQTGKPSLQILMPSLKTESFRDGDGYPDLEKIDIKTVLRSHILNDSGNYLLPIRLLSQLGKGGNISTLFNPYYDSYENEDPAQEYVKEAEFSRLVNHSLDTQSLYDSKLQYERLLNDEGLLGHLHELLRSLRFNSVAGVGMEEDAGGRVYGSILQFKAYYEALDDERKKAIPNAVRDEIEKLLLLSFNVAQNKIGTENTETCIATRQRKLRKAVDANEKALKAISIDDNKRKALFEEVVTEFEAKRKALEEDIQNRTYREGCDKLGITAAALLKQFNVKPEITSRAAFQDFMTLSGSEIEIIGQEDESLREAIVK